MKWDEIMRLCALILVGAIMLLGCASAASLLEENYTILENLGIEIPLEAKETISKAIDETLETMPEEIREEYGYNRDYFSDITSILAWVGYGNLDYETWISTPYSNDVYAFDAELYDIEGGYLELFDAVERLSNGEANIEDCEVLIGEELFLEGEGEFPITFTLNGQDCSYMAKLQTDWMDCEIIDYLNRVMKDQGIGNSIWSMYDGGQGLIILYNDEQWVREFEDATGCELVRGTGPSMGIEGLLEFFM